MRRFRSRWLPLREAARFVAKHHRHHEPIHIGILAVGLWEGERLVGVAVLGRPLSRNLDARGIIEITRLCVLDDSRHAASALLARARRVAQALGFECLVTYTAPEEGGASLRAANYQRDLELVGGRVWDTPTRRRNKPLTSIMRRVRWWSGLRQQKEFEL
jgi:hypothetical protein